MTSGFLAASPLPHLEWFAIAGFYGLLAILFLYLARHRPPMLLARSTGRSARIASALTWIGLFFAGLCLFTLGLGAGG